MLESNECAKTIIQDFGSREATGGSCSQSGLGFNFFLGRYNDKRI